MNSIINQVKKAAIEATLAAFDHVSAESIKVTQSTKPSFGHYQCNCAMALAKQVGKKPREIAEIIKQELSASTLFSKIEIAGPGFINFWLSPEFIEDAMQDMTKQPSLGCKVEPQRMVIDFSAPNVAKEMHVGHLRSTIIGDCLANLFEYMGHDVLRLNHIGDWGTAFGMLIAFLKEHHPTIIESDDAVELVQLMAWYKESKQLFDKDEAFKKRSQLQVVALQSGEPLAYKAWEKICAISQKAYEEIYNTLNVRIIPRGESFYNDRLASTVELLEKKGMLEVSDGAKCIFLEGFTNREGEPLPFMIQKSDGGFNYASTDMAALNQRANEEKAQRIMVVTDAGQATHFKMLYAAGRKAGFVPEHVVLDHVPFGLVLGKDGKKFKTRSGDTERLADLLEAAVSKAGELLTERNDGEKSNFTKDEIETLAKALGIGAVKYADLSNSRVNDYTFSYDRMLSFEGNTAAFLMYSYVRIQSIIRKSKIDISDLQKTRFPLEHSSELALGVHLLQFHEVLEAISADLCPHRLCDYLYNLANTFNAFFRDCKVIGSEQQNQRLHLCLMTKQVLEAGFAILGLETVERM